MKVSLNFLIYLSVTILLFQLSCKKKIESEDCVYTIEEHKLKIVNKNNIKIYKDKLGFTVFDERNKSGFGSAYYFYNNVLLKYAYYTSNSSETFNYGEIFDTTHNLIQTIQSPITEYNYYEDSTKHIELFIQFYLLNKKVKKALLFSMYDSTAIKIYPREKYPNIYYSSILLAKQNRKSVFNDIYYLKLQIEHCNGKIENYQDTFFINNIIKLKYNN
jgi:hypothetical protein